MNALSAIELALGLLKGITAATANPLDDLVVAGVTAAIKDLEKVHGQPVTHAQLESLRITPQW